MLFLPDISGLEVCRHLRAEGASPAAPVLFVSARASTDGLAGLEAGGDDYLPDLFDLRELGLRVEAACAGHRRHGAAPFRQMLPWLA